MAFQGLIAELALGTEGLTGSANQSKVRPSQLLVAENLTYENGTLQKEGGTSKYNSSAITGTPTIKGGHDWWPTTATQRMIVFASDGKLHKDTGGGDFTVTLASGLTPANALFVEGGKEAAAVDRKLFCFTGVNAVQVLAADGATTAALSTPPTDWSGANQPTGGIVHEGRMWGWGNVNDPHRAYYSQDTDHEDFTGGDAGSVAVYSGVGEKIVGGISFKGLLILWKYPFGIYAIDTSSTTLSAWRVAPISNTIGGISPHGAVAVDDDVLFIDPGGNFHLISAITEFGNLGTSAVSDAQNFAGFMRENSKLSGLTNARGVFYAAKRQAHFSVPAPGSSVNNRRVIVDFNRPDLIRFGFANRETGESLWLRKDTDNVPRPCTGDEGGFVRIMDQEGRSHDGAGYTGKFQSPHLDLSHIQQELGTKVKNGKFLELVVEPQGNWNLSVDTYWDDTFEETLLFNMGQSGSALGSFVLDTDVLSGSNILNKKKRITGGGRRFSLIGSNNGAGQDFSISKFYLHFKPGDERIS